jgi:hypothetical protein
MRVVEFTGGSTGSSLALVCSVKGYRFVPVSSDAFAKEEAVVSIRASGRSGGGKFEVGSLKCDGAHPRLQTSNFALT